MIAGEIQDFSQDFLGGMVADGGKLVHQEAEIAERSRGLVLEAGDIRRLAGHRQHRQAEGLGSARKVIEGSLSEAARRDVDDPREADVVLRVGEELQVAEDVLDLQSFIERHAADDLIGDLGRSECGLERAGQGRDAAEDGDVAELVFALADQGRDPGGDAVGLVVLGGINGEVDGGAVGVSRSKAISACAFGCGGSDCRPLAGYSWVLR